MPDHEVDPPLRLFVARWPGRSAMIVSAASMEEVADRLDEIGDPGACEVTPFKGPLAITITPRQSSTGFLHLDASFDALDDADDVQRAIMRAAFPVLDLALESARDERGDVNLEPDQWASAVAKEAARAMRPTAAWGTAVANWWQAMTGARADRSAALRDKMGVTIPGEPTPAPQLRKVFEAEHRRIRERIDSKLALDQPKPTHKRGRTRSTLQGGGKPPAPTVRRLASQEGKPLNAPKARPTRAPKGTGSAPVGKPPQRPRKSRR